jgi:lipopolysaccharide transport system ATP-binding protein
MSTAAIVVEGLGKRYRIGARQQLRRRRHLMESATRALQYPLRNLRRLRGLTSFAEGERESVVWALRDVSFELGEGKVLGIVGGNGAGKSTLLKIISRITEPTSGFAEVSGRVGSLLEVGTGFHPELTGRENVLLNGSILGMDRAYIRRKFDAMVDFAGVERFIDTPVKRYSSGMRLRLAFAVAAYLEPEILVIDEVLAVGDAEFQRRCLNKMGDIAREGRTVLFVSHNLDAVRALCPRSILIDDGRLVADGPTSGVIRRYLEKRSLHAAGEWIDLERAERKGSGEVRFRAVRYSSGDERLEGQPYTGGPLGFELAVEADAARTVGSVSVSIATLSGARLVHADAALTGGVRLRRGRSSIDVAIARLHLNPGRYRVSFGLADPLLAASASGAYDVLEDAIDIEVVHRRPAAVVSRVSAYVPCEASFTTVAGGVPLPAPSGVTERIA